METASEIRSILNNLRYYSKEIEELDYQTYVDESTYVGKENISLISQAAIAHNEAKGN